MPGFLAGFHPIQYIVAQLFSRGVFNVGDANAAGCHVQAQAGEVLAPLITRLRDRDALHLAEQQTHRTKTEQTGTTYDLIVVVQEACPFPVAPGKKRDQRQPQQGEQPGPTKLCESERYKTPAQATVL